MSLATVYSRASSGINAPQVTVEVDISGGLPSLSIVGLPETAVKESKDRVRSAIRNSHFEFPARRITINLAPADLPKQGGRYDLPIALGILSASGQIDSRDIHLYEFIGELALSGSIRPTHGIMPLAIKTRDANRTLILPSKNRAEAALIPGVKFIQAGHLLEVCGHISRTNLLHLETGRTITTEQSSKNDLADIHGQFQAKRALSIAAAGSHNLLMAGPPGTGKTMLASRLPGILPPMTQQEALATASVHSISNEGFRAENWGKRPFRTPHHTASAVALVGGGSIPKPGEVSLAHNGVLFLDELPEFDRRVLDVLREPIESGSISISRAARKDEFPARFQLIAAMNPCLGGGQISSGENDCSEDDKRKYLNRLSGPFLDRFDMHIKVPRLPTRDMLRTSNKEPCHSSSQIRQQVSHCRERQLKRCGKPNAHLSARETDEICQLAKKQRQMLERAVEKLGLSARAWHRILRLSRTIADMQASEIIEIHHLTEAITYRSLDRL